MDELNQQLLERAKQASLEVVTEATPEPRAHTLARMCQQMVDSYPDLVKQTGKPSVVVFQLGGADTMAAVVIHACVGATAEAALELLSLSLHKRLSDAAEAASKGGA
jgi:predicted PP-loop superfamily ATPase